MADPWEEVPSTASDRRARAAKSARVESAVKGWWSKRAEHLATQMVCRAAAWRTLHAGRRARSLRSRGIAEEGEPKNTRRLEGGRRWPERSAHRSQTCDQTSWAIGQSKNRCASVSS